jgi:hypothetical protein
MAFMLLLMALVAFYYMDHQFKELLIELID